MSLGRELPGSTLLVATRVGRGGVREPGEVSGFWPEHPDGMALWPVLVSVAPWGAASVSAGPRWATPAAQVHNGTSAVMLAVFL